MGCTHKDQIRIKETTLYECRECIEQGDRWVHLRMCLTCGYVGCCDSSVNQHARKHFEETGHPLIRSVEPGEDWGWCYIDEIYFRVR